MASKKYSQYINEMMLAVQVNIEFLRKQGSSQMKIRNGNLVNVSGDVFVYQFELEALQEIDPGTDVEIRVHAQSVSGRIVAVLDSSVDIQLESNLGEKISEAMLLISNYYLLEKLSERLKIIKDDSGIKSDIAEKILKLKSTTIHPDSDYNFPARENKLNPSQERAVRNCLGNDVTFIWGPPGTGKSMTIANIVEGFLSKNLSVLLISHTNKATDGAMIKVVEHLKNTTDYEEGKFIREGNIKSIDEKLKNTNVIPENIQAKKSLPIKEEMDDILIKINSLNSELSTLENYAKKLKLLEKHQQEQERLVMLFESKKKEKNALIAQRESHISKIKEIDDQLLNFQSKNFIGKLFSGTSLDKLTDEKISTRRKQDECVEKVELINAEIWNIETKISSINLKIETNSKELSSLGQINVDYAVVEKIKKDIKHLNEQYKALADKLLDLGNDLIKEAKIVATTLTRSYMSKNILDREYDCLIIDEASMAPIPAIICAASLAQKKAVLVGDFFQLPPIAKHNVNASEKSPEDAEKERLLVESWLKRDIFDFVGITGDIRNGIIPSEWLVQLKEQFRMHPDISALVNKLVYEHFNSEFGLENGEDTHEYGKEKIKNVPLSNAHLGIFDTGKIGAIPSKTDSGSIYNITHALLIIDLAKQAIESGYKKIGIISAYRAQVNLIQKMLKDEIPESLDKIAADTVHRFQGDEKEIIIFDVTTPKSKTMYDDGKDGGDDMKLLNVAFSRAKEKCIIVVDVPAIKKSHSQTSLVRKAIEHCEEQKCPIIDCENMLHSFSADDRTEEWIGKINNVGDILEDIENAKLFSESDFYPNFIRDLLRAKSEVIINSPFITTYRSDKLKPIFQHLLHKKIRIFIITRPPEEHKDNMKEQSLKELKEYEKMGIVVIPLMGNIHQKFSIIDRKIMWDGSLNILSQRDSNEIMRRYEGQGAIDQYMTFLRLDKNIGEMGKNNLKHCEICKSPGAWYWKKKLKFGNFWTFCLVGIHGVGKKPKTKEEKEKKKSVRSEIRNIINLDKSGTPLCPKHGISTVQKEGYWGHYWSCPKFKECDYQISDQKVKKFSAKI